MKLGKTNVCVLLTAGAPLSNCGWGKVLAAKASFLLGTQVSCHLRAVGCVWGELPGRRRSPNMGDSLICEAG